MKDDHIVAGIFLLLISALVLGALSQSSPNGITSAAVSIPFFDGSSTAIVTGVLVALALIASAYGIYQLYFKRKKNYNFPVSKHVGLEIDSMGMLPEAKDASEIDPKVDQVRQYILKQRAKGEDDHDIHAKLNAVGWDAETVKKAFK